MSKIRILDPTMKNYTTDRQSNTIAPRVVSLDGITIGLLSNGKARALELMHYVIENLEAKYFIREVITFVKSHPSRPVAQQQLESILQRCQAVITAIGD